MLVIKLFVNFNGNKEENLLTGKVIKNSFNCFHLLDLLLTHYLESYLCIYDIKEGNKTDVFPCSTLNNAEKNWGKLNGMQ